VLPPVTVTDTATGTDPWFAAPRDERRPGHLARAAFAFLL
jgi:hypothetical protein